jgi:hypothetical protein
MERTFKKSLFAHTRAELLSEIQLLSLGLVDNPFSRCSHPHKICPKAGELLDNNSTDSEENSSTCSLGVRKITFKEDLSQVMEIAMLSLEKNTIAQANEMLKMTTSLSDFQAKVLYSLLRTFIGRLNYSDSSNSHITVRRFPNNT